MYIVGLITNHIMLDLPERYREDARRGTEQLRVLDYRAQAEQSALVGVSLRVANHAVEYWLPMNIDPIAELPLETYLSNLQAQWHEKIRQISPWAAQFFGDESMRYVFKMRYQGNGLRVWLTPEAVAAAGINNNNNNIYAGGPRRVPPATSDSTP
jgi:hypothetical protein